MAALTILAIVGVVSWRLNQGVSHQAQMITNDMTMQTNESLDSYHHILEIFLDSTTDDATDNEGHLQRPQYHTKPGTRSSKGTLPHCSINRQSHIHGFYYLV
jgi:hypothetical protein